MTPDHRRYADDLRADAWGLRTLVASLERRADEHERLADAADAQRAEDDRRRTARAALVRPHDEDRHSFRGVD